METTYQPKAIENSWYQYWEECNYFSPYGKGSAYSIVIPPPNVTGNLHMGHAFQQSIMDAFIRYQRMQNRCVLWKMGTDHAGIATQMVVEKKLLADEQKTRHDLGRDAFIQKIWQWKKMYGHNISQQMKQLGFSVDWQSERFTMDDRFSQAVKKAFIQLYDDQLVYRHKKLVNWDPQLKTVISDLEVEHREIQGHLWYFRYPLESGVLTSEKKTYIVIATTRPETMLGDSAVAVHPDDQRYQHLIGKHVILPISHRVIPILGDKKVDPAFGTGCVKITPAHDFNDYEMGKRHQLLSIDIMSDEATLLTKARVFNTDGSLNKSVELILPEKWHHLDRFKVRQHLIEDLKEQNLLEKIDKHTLTVPYGDRSQVVIEPRLTDQWFIKIQPLASEAVQAVKNKKIQFVPESYENMFFSWMNDIQDWCISRQLWWGHRIPAWYDPQGHVFVANNEEEVRKKYQLSEDIVLTQDDDVFDTWFSAGLWTFASLGWPECTKELQKFHPTNLLVTGFDIIFFWVARMMMLTMYLMKDDKGVAQIPFHKIYIHGLVRDEQGQKMSKSKGNVLDPLDMIHGIDLDALIKKRTHSMMQPQMAKKIEQRTKKQFPQGINAHGADALRYTLYSLASKGRDINWDMKRLEGYRNFCNKLWNASRYVLLNLQEKQYKTQEKTSYVEQLPDRWIVSRLQNVIEKVHGFMQDFRLDHVSQMIYEFIWHDYCDWYLELSKITLMKDQTNTSQEIQATCHTLFIVLEKILRLAHPLIPFITEEIWQKIKMFDTTLMQQDSLMIQQYPIQDVSLMNDEAEKNIKWLQDMVGVVRNIRRDYQIPLNKKVDVKIRGYSDIDKIYFDNSKKWLQAIGKISSLSFIDTSTDDVWSAVQFIDSLEVIVPLAGLMNKNDEICRLQERVKKQKEEVTRLSKKLQNNHFLDNAPVSIIEKEKEKLKTAQETLKKMTQKIHLIESS